MNGSDLDYEDTMYYKIAKTTQKTVNMLLDALNKPGRFRLWLIKKIFPEIIEVADVFYKEVIWKRESVL